MRSGAIRIAVTATGKTSVTHATSTAPKIAARRCASCGTGRGATHSPMKAAGAPAYPAHDRQLTPPFVVTDGSISRATVHRPWVVCRGVAVFAAKSGARGSWRGSCTPELR